MLKSTIYPSVTPLILFQNQTTDGVSPIFTAGDNPEKNRLIVLQFLGTLGDATITQEQQEKLSGNWHSTGDIIDNPNTYERTNTFACISGNFRLRITNAGNGTNITAIMQFSDTKQ